MERANYPLIITDEIENHWVKNESNEAYHANKKAVGSSALKKLLFNSPLHFYESHVLGVNEPPTPAMEFGSLVHSAILEPEVFRKTYRIEPDFGDLRKKENKEKREAWFNDLPRDVKLISPEWYESLMGILESVSKNEYVTGLLSGSAFETSGYYRDPATNIFCKIRPDAFNQNLNIVLDIKTTQDASRESFEKSIASYGYDFQAAMYMEGIERITGKRPKAWCFLAIEKTPPYAIAFYQTDNLILDTATAAYRHALEKLKACLVDDVWPGYGKKAKIVTMPKWRLYEIENLITSAE